MVIIAFYSALGSFSPALFYVVIMAKTNKEKALKSRKTQKEKASADAVKKNLAEQSENPVFIDKYHLGGRPPSFKSVDEMIAKATAYFSEKENDIIGYSKNGNAIFGQGSISVKGVCDYMGITNETLNQYGKKKESAYTVTRIKQICEVYLIDRCNLSKDHKADWILQNCFDGWKTESTTNLAGGMNVVMKKYNWEDDDDSRDTNSERLESASLSAPIVESAEQRG